MKIKKTIKKVEVETVEYEHGDVVLINNIPYVISINKKKLIAHNLMTGKYLFREDFDNADYIGHIDSMNVTYPKNNPYDISEIPNRIII